MRLFTFMDTNARGTKPSPPWTKRIGSAFKSLFGEEGNTPIQSPSDKETFTHSYGRDTNFFSEVTIWKTYQDRKSVYQDLKRMDNEDEIVSTALDVFASSAFPMFEDNEEDVRFKIICNDAEHKKIIDDLVKRLNLQEDIWQLSRECVLHGNIFREVVIDRNATPKCVQVFKQTISYQIWPKTNEKGDKVPGWETKLDEDVYNNGGQNLEEWQICPFLFGAKQGYFVVPTLASARRNWIRLSMLEDGMATARLIRAYDKYVHKIPVKAEWSKDQIINAIRLYKDAISRRKLMTSEGLSNQNDNPLSVQTDFYIPDDGTGRGGVDNLTSNNTQLTNLNDILYSRERLLVRLKVPVQYLQIITAMKTHMGKGTGAGAEEQFRGELRHLRSVVVQGLRRLIGIELLLRGIDPAKVDYKISMPRIETDNLKEDAEVMLTYAQAAVYFIEAFGMLPPELLAEKFLNLTVDQQKVFDKFLTDDYAKIKAAKLKTIQKAGEKPSINGGPGNNNKALAPRSSEQVGAKKQQAENASIPFEAAVDAFIALYQEVNPNFDGEAERATIEKSLLNIVTVYNN